ncbi:MAG: lipoyl(octanoyl) transferase LipB [Pseudomonadota bacterium]
MEWDVATDFVEYPAALAAMAARVAAVQQGRAPELGWMVEHPPLYTLGTSANAADVLGAGGIPTYETGRGGQVTYHGPGQQIVYLMRDLKRHAGPAGPDLRAYVRDLERWIILTLEGFGIEGFIRPGRVGVWVQTPRGEAKIAALGVRVQKWVTSHGIALNVQPDLRHYAGIVPCGIREFGVTSLQALGQAVTMEQARAALRDNFSRVFA